MKAILNQLFEHQHLSEKQAYEILTRIGNGEFNQSQMASFLTVYLMRNISVDELKGFRNALLDLCLKVDFTNFNTIDVCGTGGDGKNTFNISTISAFLIAGAGYKVAKHGNYGVSSSVGSSNILEHLGYKFTNDESILKHQLEKSNFCMMHAPLFHPAMKIVAPIRRELGVKTFFNLLGPLVNPSSPQQQLIGVFNSEIARIYNYLLQESGISYQVLHSLDGYDEISLTAPFKVVSPQGEKLMNPDDIGFKKLSPNDIFGGESIEETANIFLNIVKNESTEAQKNVVIANSAMAIKCFEINKSIEECKSIALESIESGRAYKSLNNCIE